MNLMKSSSGPNLSVEKEASPRTKLGKIKKVFNDLKDKMTGKDHKTGIRKSGVLKGQWKQTDLPRIVKKIVDSNPGLTDIEIYSSEIRWHCEMNYFDLFPNKRKGSQNPSKREEN